MPQPSQMTQAEIDIIITNNKIRLNTNDHKELSKLFPGIKTETQLSGILYETVGLFNKINTWFQGTTMFHKTESNAMIYRYDCKKHSTNYFNGVGENVCILFHMQQKQIHNILNAAISFHLNPPLSFKEPILKCKIFLESINSLKETNKKEEEEQKAAAKSQNLKGDTGLFKDLLDSIESAFDDEESDETFLKFKYKYKKLKDYFETKQSFNKFLFGAIPKGNVQTTRFDILVDTANQQGRLDISAFLNSIDQRSPSSSSQATSTPPPPPSSMAASSAATPQSSSSSVPSGSPSTMPSSVPSKIPSVEELNQKFDDKLRVNMTEEGGYENEAGTKTNKERGSIWRLWSRPKADETHEKIKASQNEGTAPGAGEDEGGDVVNEHAPLTGPNQSGLLTSVWKGFGNRMGLREKQTDSNSSTRSDSNSSTRSDSNSSKRSDSDVVEVNSPLHNTRKGGKKTRKRRKPRKTRRKKQKKSKRKTKAKK